MTEDAAIYTAPRPASVDHDPIDRAMEGEPHFALMGRDPIAPGLVRLYAHLREGKYDQVHGLLDVVIARAKTRAPHPQKDTQHAWSARRIAGEMEEFHRQHMRGEEPVSRVNLGSGREFPTVHPEDIKRAVPPREPDEAS